MKKAAVAGVLALALVAWWALRVAPPDATAPPPASRAPQAPAGRVVTRAAPTEPLRSTALGVEAAVGKAAMLMRLAPAGLGRGHLDRLLAGDVATAAKALAASSDPGAAAALAELAAFCDELTATAPGSAAAEATPVADPANRDPTLTATLGALTEARRSARERLRGRCAATRFDHAAIERQLSERALAGDAASLERQVRSGALPASRLESAALLGSARAQLQLGLDRLHDTPATARTWLEAAARTDPEAGGLYGGCLLDGCGGPRDPLQARAVLEAAARRGSAYALGLLSTPPGTDTSGHWSVPLVGVSPVPPHGLDELGLSSAERYAWASLAGELGQAGCFGFDLAAAGEALAARGRLERTLSPSDLAAGVDAAARLIAQDAPALRRARGCD